MKKNNVSRPGDLAPKGIKSTIKSEYSFNETFEHIFYNGIGINKNKK
jgi:hypothetical protein